MAYVRTHAQAHREQEGGEKMKRERENAGHNVATVSKFGPFGSPEHFVRFESVLCVLLYYQMLKSDQITVKYILIDIPTYVTKYQVHFQVNSIAPKNSLWHYACNRLGTPR